MKHVFAFIGIMLLIGCADSCTKKERPKAPDADVIIGQMEKAESIEQGEPYDMPVTPYTQPTLILDPARGWRSEDILVPDEPGYFPYVCFWIEKHQAAECVYRAYDDTDPEVLWVLPNRKKT